MTQNFCSEQWIAAQAPIELLVLSPHQKKCRSSSGQQEAAKIIKVRLELETRGPAVDARLAQENGGRPFCEECSLEPQQVLRKSLQGLMQQYGGTIFHGTPLELSCEMVGFLRSWLQGKPVNAAVKLVTLFDEFRTEFTTDWPPSGSENPRF